MLFRSVIDLLDQIGDAVPAGAPIANKARAAIDLIDRGIISYSAVA